MSEISAVPEGTGKIAKEFALTEGSNELDRELLIDFPEVKYQLFLNGW